MQPLASVSVVVPTRDRPEVLNQLLQSLAAQSFAPLETIIVDDSPAETARSVVTAFEPNFRGLGSQLRYVRGTGDGNTSARNIGISIAKGDSVLFLDDDVILERDTVSSLSQFLSENTAAMVVQPVITAFEEYWDSMGFGARFENAVRKAMMLSYHGRDKQSVRRSAASVYGSMVTRTISVERTSGCCLVRRKVLDLVRFDTNLARYGLYDDLDFSYNVYRRYPGTLFCVPSVRIVHTASRQARLSRRTSEFMRIIYWWYVFFKDTFQSSTLNLVAFLWACIGNLTLSSYEFCVSNDPVQRWSYIFKLEAYVVCLKNLRYIIAGDLDFFNRTLLLR